MRLYSDTIRTKMGWVKMLEDLFGNNALVKVLDFLLENRFWDYTKTDIAKHSGISRVQLYRVWDRVLELGLVKKSRKIGGTTLYITNMDSLILKRLSTLSMEIADQINKPIIKKELAE